MEYVNLKPIYSIVLNRDNWNDKHKLKGLAQDLVEGRYIENGRPFTINDYSTVYYPSEWKKSYRGPMWVDVTHPNYKLRQYYKRAYAKKMRELNKVLREEKRREKELDNDTYLDVDKMKEFEKYLANELSGSTTNPLYHTPEGSGNSTSEGGLNLPGRPLIDVDLSLPDPGDIAMLAAAPVAMSAPGAAAAPAAGPAFLVSAGVALPTALALRWAGGKVLDLIDKLSRVPDPGPKPEFTIKPSDIASVGAQAQLSASSPTPSPTPPKKPNKWRNFRKGKTKPEKPQLPKLYTENGLSPTTMNLMKTYMTAAGTALGAKAVDSVGESLGYDPIFTWENPQYVEFKNDHPVVKALLENPPIISSVDKMVEFGPGSDAVSENLVGDGLYVMTNGLFDKFSPRVQKFMYKQQPLLIGADVVSDSAGNQIDKNERDKNEELNNSFDRKDRMALSEFDTSFHRQADSIRLNNSLNGVQNDRFITSDGEEIEIDDFFNELGLPTDYSSLESAVNKKNVIEGKYDNFANDEALRLVQGAADKVGYFAPLNPYTITRWLWR